MALIICSKDFRETCPRCRASHPRPEVGYMPSCVAGRSHRTLPGVQDPDLHSAGGRDKSGPRGG